MPPGDTIILNNFDELPDSIRHIIDSITTLNLYQLSEDDKRPQFLFPQWQIILFVFLVAFSSAYFYIIRPASAEKRKIKKILGSSSAENTIARIQYDQWLHKYNPYYQSLPGGLKKRFLRRTLCFKASKEFRFHYMQPDELPALLISGAAVQLTFGLKHFLIDFFPVINIVKREYSYSGGNNVVEGHVRADKRTISISWNNFIYDYEDYSDSQNVGLHELAHAISYDFLYGFQENKQPHYEDGLKKYIQVAAPVFKELQQGKRHIIDDYAAINVEEFWAVSIETFFENPEEFRNKVPGLYDAICELLNQNPLQRDKILNKGLAGL